MKYSLLIVPLIKLVLGCFIIGHKNVKYCCIYIIMS